MISGAGAGASARCDGAVPVRVLRRRCRCLARSTGTVPAPARSTGTVRKTLAARTALFWNSAYDMSRVALEGFGEARPRARSARIPTIGGRAGLVHRTLLRRRRSGHRPRSPPPCPCRRTSPRAASGKPRLDSAKLRRLGFDVAALEHHRQAFVEPLRHAARRDGSDQRMGELVGEDALELAKVLHRSLQPARESGRRRRRRPSLATG